VTPSSADPRDRLDAALVALGLDASDAQRDALLRYVQLLQRWNTVYNLTAVREPGRMLSHHIFDCLAAVRPLWRVAADGRSRLIDVGSGAGLPGVVFAVMGPSLEVSCVDSVGKKTSFVQQVAGELGLHNLRSVHARVEDLTRSADIVAARAYADLRTLISSTRHLMADDGIWMALKARVPTEEMAALPKDVDLFHVEQLTVPELPEPRCIVWMRLRAP